MPSYQIKQSSTACPLVFLLISATDHITGLTGASATVTLSKAGGAFASPSGTVTEVANGWYKVAGNATDTGTLGPLLLHATAIGADPCDQLYEIVAHDVQDAVRLGLSALPTAAPAANGGLLTVGLSAGQISPVSGGVDIRTIVAQNVTCSSPVTVYASVGTANEVATDSSGRVSLNPTQVLSSPRALDAIADGSITITDAFWGAVCKAAGKESVTGTSYVIQTPSTGTTIRTFILNSGTNPSSRA